MLLRHAEVAEDEQEDEEIVDAERLLDDVAGDELQRELRVRSRGMRRPDDVRRNRSAPRRRAARLDPQAAVQAMASRKPTTCVLRWKTPRSSASIASTNTLKISQKIQFAGITGIRNSHSTRRQRGTALWLHQCYRWNVPMYSALRQHVTLASRRPVARGPHPARESASHPAHTGGRNSGVFVPPEDTARCNRLCRSCCGLVASRRPVGRAWRRLPAVRAPTAAGSTSPSAPTLRPGASGSSMIRAKATVLAGAPLHCRAAREICALAGVLLRHRSA